MSLINYLRERWLAYLFGFAAFAFSFIVYKLDNKFSVTKSNASYILMGIVLLLIVFIFIDYSILNERVKKFKLYCGLNTISFDLEEFSYPIDIEYAKMVRKIAMEYEKYKSDICNESAEELEFITKWVHDIKVPVSAVRLILENSDDDIPYKIYKKLDTQMTLIEQCTKTVFYNIKSNAFYNDYKIAEVSTRKLISDSLKAFSNFFIYKNIKVITEGENHIVLTDEKYSGYIISQIISNAVKYTPINGSIKIITEKNKNKVDIKIKNTGKGILPCDIGQVFNKGYTMSKDRDRMNATGYGMYLSKKISSLLGHELNVESVYNEYTQFSLSINCSNSIYDVTKM